jgi:hypothetical protein
VNGQPAIIGDELANRVTSLTHSTDLSRGLVFLIGNDLAINEEFHLASEEVVTWLEVYQIAARAVGVELDLLELPESTILEVFPELRGKVSDRLLDRAFDNRKFRSACPDFQFERSVADGYREAISARLQMGVRPDAVSAGRQNRLARSRSVPGRPAKAMLTLRRGAAVESIRYLSGRYALLDYVRRRTFNRGRSEYGI